MTARRRGRERVMRPGSSTPRLSVWPALIIAMAFVAGVVPACAQDYPSRPITVIVPFPAGGASDVVARIVTNQMSKALGQSIIIENVSGAGGLACGGACAYAERQVRSAQGLRADRHHRPFAGRRHRAEGFSGAGLEGIRCRASATGCCREAGTWRHRRVLAHGVP